MLHEDERPGSFILAELIQIFGVLALADSLLPLPFTVWEPELSVAVVIQLVDNLEQMNKPPCLRHIITIVSYGVMKSTPLPLRRAEEDKHGKLFPR